MKLSRRRQAKLAPQETLTAVAEELEPFANATCWPAGGPLPQHLLPLTKPHTNRAFWLDGWASGVTLWGIKHFILLMDAFWFSHAVCFAAPVPCVLFVCDAFTVHERIPCWHPDAATADVPCAAPAPSSPGLVGQSPSQAPLATFQAVAPSQVEYAIVEHEDPRAYRVVPFCIIFWVLMYVPLILVVRLTRRPLFRHVNFLYLMYAADYTYRRAQQGIANGEFASCAFQIQAGGRGTGVPRNLWRYKVRQDGRVEVSRSQSCCVGVKWERDEQVLNR
jgi:hypothetical protein